MHVAQTLLSVLVRLATTGKSTPLGGGQYGYQCVEFRDRFPSEQAAALFRVAAAVGDFGRAKEGGGDCDVVVPVEVEAGEGGGRQLLQRVTFAGGDDEVLRLVLLEHAPHRLDVFGGVTPIAGDVESSKREAAAG